jgi:hypothetical protein
VGDLEAQAAELLGDPLAAEDAGGTVGAARGTLDDRVEIDRGAGEPGR